MCVEVLSVCVLSAMAAVTGLRGWCIYGRTPQKLKQKFPRRSDLRRVLLFGAGWQEVENAGQNPQTLRAKPVQSVEKPKAILTNKFGNHIII